MRIALFAAALCCIAVTARSQTLDSTRSRWASGMSVGIPGEMGGEAYPILFTVGANFTQVGRGVGADIAIFTVPRIMPEGAIPIVGRLGVGLPIAMHSDEGGYFVPSAGVFGAGIASGSGGGATGGWYAGMALVALGNGGSGLRAAYNLYGLEGAGAWHLEIGFVRGGRK